MIKDLRLQTATVGGKITPALINAINATIRRYKPIAGKGVTIHYAPYGSIISSTATGGVAGGSGGGASILHPFKCSFVDDETHGQYIAIYLPSEYDGTSCAMMNYADSRGIAAHFVDASKQSITTCDNVKGDSWARLTLPEIDFDTVGITSTTIMGVLYYAIGQASASTMTDGCGCGIMQASDAISFMAAMPAVTNGNGFGSASSSTKSEYLVCAFPIAHIEVTVTQDGDGDDSKKQVSCNIKQYAFSAMTAEWDGIGDDSADGGESPTYNPPDIKAKYVPYDVVLELPN